MNFLNNEAEIAVAALSKWCDQTAPAGQWRWRCAVQNGTLLPLSARFADGFFRLETQPDDTETGPATLARAAEVNAVLTGGVKIAADSATRALMLCTDIVILDAAQLLERLEWALAGFHECLRLLQASRTQMAELNPSAEEVLLPAAQDLLDNIPWQLTPLESGEYSAILEADAARPARVRLGRRHTSVSVDLVRADSHARLTQQALASYLLTATGTLRFVRACCMQTADRNTYSLEVLLPATPRPEELNHALASLSIAHRMCVREATALLDEPVASRYLAAQETSTGNLTEETKEECYGQSGNQ